MKTRIVKIQAVEDYYPASFSQSVNRLIEEGYQPLGPMMYDKEHFAVVMAIVEEIPDDTP